MAIGMGGLKGANIWYKRRIFYRPKGGDDKGQGGVKKEEIRDQRSVGSFIGIGKDEVAKG